MKVFMNEFYKKYKGRNITIIMDGAGWHKDFQYLLKETQNIEITLQPTYSPELNPVEKLWQYIKDKTIKNQIYKNIKDLENTICDFIKNNLNSKIIQSVCSVSYMEL